MSIELATLDPHDARVIEQVVIQGDLKALSPQDRVAYYNMRCDAAGLDPRTQPFLYVTLQGKLTLYATKTATEQLCEKRNISTEIRNRQQTGDVYFVECRASLSNGRFTDSTGAVSIKGKNPDELANAIMKAETKAKRRAVLALCGLGMLDETELETIPNAFPQPAAAPGEVRDFLPAIAPPPGLPMATEEQLEYYSQVRERAVELGFLTPSGNQPAVANSEWTERICKAKTVTLKTYIEQQEAKEESAITASPAEAFVAETLAAEERGEVSEAEVVDELVTA